MVNVERISVSFSKHLLKEIDSLAKRKGYSSRSELIRNAVRKHVLENNQLRDEHVSGIITVVYTPTSKNMKEMGEIYFKYNDLIKSINQSYITTSCGKNKKVEVYIVEGNGKCISKLYDSVENIDNKIYTNIVIF